MNTFINKIIENINIAKEINGNIPVMNKKIINDILTDIINRYFVENNLVNTYLETVLKYFKDFDSHYSNDNYMVNKDVIIGNNNTYTISDNLINRNISTYRYRTRNININNKGYLIFKGGNCIKYITLKKYYKSFYNIIINDFNTILNLKLNLNNNKSFNTYSDFDFTYYVSNFDNNKYEKLVKHIMLRLFLLRNNLENIFNNNNILQNLQNIKLHYEISNYFENKGQLLTNNYNQLTFNQNINLSSKIQNIIITKKNNILSTHTYDESDHMMNISFNNIIRTKTTDFDLYRIKLNFNTNNNIKQSIFKSEIFDLTILRPTDTHRDEFCENINYNTFFLTNNNIFLRCYSIKYLLKDLLSTLFITSQSYDTIFPWNDKKYEKRIIRLSLLYALWLDYIETIYKNNLEDNHNKYTFYKNLIIINFIVILNYVINTCENLIIQMKNNLIKEFILYFSFNILFDSIAQNDLKNECTEQILDEIYVIITTYKKEDINEELIKNYKKKINDDLFDEFMLITFIIYFNKIFVSHDQEWCKRYSSDPLMNIYDYYLKAQQFIKLFSIFLLDGLTKVTFIIENYYKDNILHGGQNDNYKTTAIHSKNDSNYKIYKSNELYNKFNNCYILIVNKLELKCTIKNYITIIYLNNLNIDKINKYFFDNIKLLKKLTTTFHYLNIEDYYTETYINNTKSKIIYKKYKKKIKDEIFNDSNRLNILINEQIKIIISFIKYQDENNLSYIDDNIYDIDDIDIETIKKYQV